MPEVILSVQNIRKLLAAGNGDCALLYLSRVAGLSDVVTGFSEARLECAASLLLANDVSMKQIQEWLGHSDFSTTANIYAHLDYSSKLSSADALLGGLGLS